MGLTWDDNTITVGTEATATITFNDDDVEWIYVDWDDGEDNSVENAIYQWERLKTDSNSITMTHIYNKVGVFYPVIRTVNNQGIISKYLYDNSKTPTTIPKPREQVTSIGQITVSDGTPSGVIRVENKVVKSGIDNSIFNEGPKDVYLYRPPTNLSTSNMADIEILFEITYLDTAPQTHEVNDGQSDRFDTGLSTKIRTLTAVMHNGTNSVSATKLAALGKVTKILEFKQLTVKRIGDTNVNVNDFNKIKTFLIAQSDAEVDANSTPYFPITYVSNGDPIKKSSERNVTLDFTQSTSKASNQSIADYYIDNGKIWFGPNGERWQTANGTTLKDDTKTTLSTKEIGYTYMPRPDGVKPDTGGGGGKIYKAFNLDNTAANAPSTYNQTVGSVGDDNYQSRTKANQFPLDDFNRFYDYNHLARVNVKTAGGTEGALDAFKFVYRAAPPLGGADKYYYIDQNALSKDYTTSAYLNYSSSASLSLNYEVSVSGMNTSTFVSTDGSTARNAIEYMILANDVKTNKIFFNISPFSQDHTFVASGNTAKTGITVAGVYYLRTGSLIEGDRFTEFAEWVPVDFKDTTKVTREIRDAGNSRFIEYSSSFTKPGFIEFDMPKDWAKISISGLTGGKFNQVGSSLGAPGVGGLGKELSNVTYVSNYNNGGAEPYDYQISKLATNELASYDPKVIGSFKYLYQVKDASAAKAHNKTFWVASSSATHLFVVDNVAGLIGSQYSAGNEIDGYLRKINAYDVFDGVMKIGRNTDSEKGNPPDAAETNYPYTFMWNDAAEKTNLASNFVDIYPIKIVLDGGGTGNTVTHFESGARPGVELWDILPFNNSNSQVVIQKDNTAFDMSFMELTSDVSVAYAGTYYSSISKGGKVTIIRTGTPIQKITFAGNALGDEATFSFSEEYLSYNTLHKLRRIEAEAVRVMWDEKQKDGSYVRFFGYIEGVTETHSNQGPKASKPFTFTMIVEEICLIEFSGVLMSDITPLGGVADGNTYS
tara:strand:- start:2911 stop:5895 length:2985 start_codon:yes stop_codon:yes gene_type:complete